MYQQIVLIGRVGQKDFAVTAQQQTPVCKLSLATSKSFKDRDGNWKENTEWHRIIMFRKCAEHVDNTVSVGDLLLVKGEIRTRKWQDKDGSDRYTTEIIVDDFPRKLPRYFTKDGASNGQPGDSSNSHPEASSSSRPSQAPHIEEEFPDDDIPF
jgi:single-strand DNA-binding protein